MLRLGCQASARAFADGLRETWHVVAGRCHDERMSGVEVAVGEHVAHARDLGPRELGFQASRLVIEFLDRLSDLDEPHPDRIEHEVVGCLGALGVIGDSFRRHGDVDEAAGGIPTHSGTASRSTRSATSGFNPDAGATSTERPRIASAALCMRSSAKRPASVKIDQQVDVARFGLVAAGDTAEHADVDGTERSERSSELVGMCSHDRKRVLGSAGSRCGVRSNPADFTSRVSIAYDGSRRPDS